MSESCFSAQRYHKHLLKLLDEKKEKEKKKNSLQASSKGLAEKELLKRADGDHVFIIC